MRHAFLIIAHEKRAILDLLLSRLDCPHNEIFIHIDKKAGFDKALYQPKIATVNYAVNRIDGRWGDFSLVEIELKLIKSAIKRGGFGYLHLISGVDLPVKPLKFIDSECEKHRGQEFIGFASNVTLKELNWRSQHWFMFSNDFKSKSVLKRGLRYGLNRLHSLIGYKRCELEIKKGSQWWSITPEFAEYILNHEDYIRKNFAHTYCPDEMVFQTLCWNSSFRSKIYRSDDEFKGCCRYIPWDNGSLRQFEDIDFRRMKEPFYWFARKFQHKDLPKYEQFFHC
ncbi:MAG: beta-1,6-N-acetylglucosaminyltransferase [Muribaculaceae bacterium]|nr:beta-1,6-N-acetylglucosaminyltransferase [Muribaculaceae bacterium]